jgi:hypothetical protein
MCMVSVRQTGNGGVYVFEIAYEMLPISSGNLTSARDPVVVRPSAARCAEQYTL